MDTDRLDALERLAVRQAEALQVLAAHMRALVVVNGALVHHLGATADIDAIRQSALRTLEERVGKDEEAEALVGTLTGEMAGAPGGMTLAAAGGVLQ